MEAKQPRLLDQVRESIRYKHYSLATEKILRLLDSFFYSLVWS